MKIAVCDDSEEFNNSICEQLRRYAKESGELIKITTYTSGDRFLNQYDINKDIDILFLDIIMDGTSGIDVAHKVRESGDKVYIIFLTSTPKYVFEGYNVSATNYLIKPIKYNILKRELDRIKHIAAMNEKGIIIQKNDSGVYKIYLNDIQYVETYNRNTLYHTVHGNILSYKNMKQHTAELGYGFVRIHEGYIVNLRYILSLKNMEVILSNGESLRVSKSKYKLLKAKIIEYYSKEL